MPRSMLSLIWLPLIVAFEFNRLMPLLLQDQLARNARRQNSLLLAGLLLAAGLITGHSEASNAALFSKLFYIASSLSVIFGWIRSRKD